MNATVLRTEFDPPLVGATDGPLCGTRFVAKDNFDVAGHRTGCGHPLWLEQSSPAPRHAAAVARLLGAGASLVGKAQLDEFAFSLSGTNAHYGTPPNPAAPDREPGGSSSGSASAVAGGIVDFALGSDTAGSVRIPASYCGVLGFRASHGRVETAGLAPLAPCFDAVGWFARSGVLLERVSRVLLGTDAGQAVASRLLVPHDVRRVLASECAASFDEATARAAARLNADPAPVELCEAGDELASWCEAFRVLQGREVWRSWGEWVTEHRPSMGPGVATRFAFASELSAAQEQDASAVRERARLRLAELLTSGTLLAIPTAVGAALPLGMGREAKNERRGATLLLSTLAPLAGAPAVSLPLCSCEGLPLGLTLMAAPGGDERLLAAARALVP